MVIISKTKIIEFYTKEPKATEVLLQWYNITLKSDWSNFHEIKQVFNSVDSVGNDRYVFDIGGNKYRIVAMIHFSKRTIYLKFVGTHKEYDKIDCKTI
ncbi:MAG: type II toxin-antitoxin system HigB family toxin [Bacteroidia bacterium]|jgi:mRNA interferase HigB